MDSQVFAFGCFHFGLRESPPADFKVRDYATEVERAIESIPNVDKVDITYERETENSTVPKLDGDPPHLESNGPYPQLLFGRISFDLLIPFRLQKELSVRPAFSTNTERFVVSILYWFHVPIVAVRLIDPSSEPDPSDAIIIVRELLNREFKKQQSLIDFQVLGPSPLHADCFLYPAAGDRLSPPWAFDLEAQHIRGYDRYNFYFNQTLFSDSAEALEILIREVAPELDLFYTITQRESRKIDSWTEINGATYSLIELHRKRGPKAVFERTFKGSRLVNDTFVSLAEFEGNVIMESNLTRDNYRHIYSSDTLPYFQELVDSAMDERSTYPTEQTRSLLQMFETRRLSAAELRVVLISAVSGGAFGALVTALAGGA